MMFRRRLVVAVVAGVSGLLVASMFLHADDTPPAQVGSSAKGSQTGDIGQHLDRLERIAAELAETVRGRENLQQSGLRDPDLRQRRERLSGIVRDILQAQNNLLTLRHKLDGERGTEQSKMEIDLMMNNLRYLQRERMELNRRLREAISLYDRAQGEQQLLRMAQPSDYQIEQMLRVIDPEFASLDMQRAEAKSQMLLGMANGSRGNANRPYRISRLGSTFPASHKKTMLVASA